MSYNKYFVYKSLAKYNIYLYFEGEVYTHELIACCGTLSAVENYHQLYEQIMKDTKPFLPQTNVAHIIFFKKKGTE